MTGVQLQAGVSLTTPGTNGCQVYQEEAGAFVVPAACDVVYLKVARR